MGIRLALLVAAVACVLPLFGASLRAASLEGIQGEVLVDRGGGFDIVAGPTTLSPGNSVIANPGSSALIVYSAECKVSVQPGAVVAVHESAPCGNGGGGSSGTFGSTTLLVGAAVAGLGAGAAILLTAGDSEAPASP